MLPLARRVVLWDDALSAVRAHFRATGVREVSTAIRVAAPAIEGEIDPIRADGHYLATRPELAMKRLLVAGSGSIFQIAHAFRRESVGPLHREEFHLLEWYRLDERLDTALADGEAVVAACHAAAETAGPSRWIRGCVLDLIEETLGVALDGDEDAIHLRERVGAVDPTMLAGAPEAKGASSEEACGHTLGAWIAFLGAWSDKHFVAWLSARPGVGVHLCDFPAVLSAMAETESRSWSGQATRGRRWAHRFESYVGGVEWANGYRELRDAGVQRARLRDANALRGLRGRGPLPLDEAFLADLEHPGLPPCAGVAMGLDRLLMRAVGAAELDAISTLVIPAWPLPPRRPTLRSAAELVQAGRMSGEQAPAIEPVINRFQMAITPTMWSRITPEQPGLGRQFLPDARELSISPRELEDPIGDARFSPTAGLVHRYPDRVLLMPTLLCPVYCRFCFRREVVGDPARALLSADQVEAALLYIRERPAIREVILTGGDPLVLSPARIDALVASLAAMAHIRVLRIHTRVPLVAPERVTQALIGALRVRPALYVVVHANHPSEFTLEGQAALAALVEGGIPLLGQSVLLAGVNDDAATLGALMRAFVDNRVKPYYLHHLDLAEGTGHFRVSLARGRALVGALRGELSGLCQPTYMLDIPGGHGKVPIGPTYLHEGEGAYRVLDPWGGVHTYVDTAEPGQRSGSDEVHP